MAVRDRFEDIRALVKTDTPVIVDGGAHRGHMVDRFRALFPGARVHAFEPIPALAEEMRERFRDVPAVTVHHAAIGAEPGPVTFNVVANLVSSSVFEPSDTNRKYHGERMAVRETVAVDMVRLDAVLRDVRVDVIKLDLQGFELEALRGAEGILSDVRVITTEIEFVPLYDGQPLFADVDGFLRAHGFRLFNLYELYTQADGQLTAGDAVYVNAAVAD